MRHTRAFCKKVTQVVLLPTSCTRIARPFSRIFSNSPFLFVQLWVLIGICITIKLSGVFDHRWLYPLSLKTTRGMNSAHVSESAISLHHLCECLACCLQAKYDTLHVSVYTIILLLYWNFAQEMHCYDFMICCLFINQTIITSWYITSL